MAAAAVMLAVAAPLPADNTARGPYKHRPALERAWRAYAADVKDEPARELLLKDPETSLEVMVDLLYPRLSPIEADTMTDEQLDKLVDQLREDDWRIRERATTKLVTLGPTIYGRLQKYLTDRDPEVRLRILHVLNGGRPPSATRHGFPKRLRGAATELMEVWMQMEPVRNVARRNLLRLVLDDDVEHSTGYQPRGPLLTALRCSDDPKDRDLLALVRAKAGPKLRGVVRTVIHQGLSGRLRRNMAPHWKREPPSHAYDDALLRLLDPSRPKIFLAALGHVKYDERVLIHLRKVRKDVRDAALAAAVDRIIKAEQLYADQRYQLYKLLKSDNDNVFRKALGKLVARGAARHSEDLLPHLRPLLKGSSRKRKQLVLLYLGDLVGREVAHQAADELAPFLTDEDAVLRVSARKALLELHVNNRPSANVLRYLSYRTKDAKRLEIIAELYRRYVKQISGKPDR